MSRRRAPLTCSVRPYAPQALWLPDGRGTLLYYVHTTSARAATLRAMGTPARWAVIDLAKIARDLACDLPGARHADVGGIVQHALRQACGTLPEFVVAASLAVDRALTELANAPAAEIAEAAC